MPPSGTRGDRSSAAIDELSFLSPVNLGDLVTVMASVNGVGTTSMEVGVRVETENVLTGERAHTSSAYLVFVALDPATDRPRAVPPLVAETGDERRRMHEAELRRVSRVERRRAIQAHREQTSRPGSP
jgi:acyl-CoA hydrolase